jgi:hypothetical protein
LTAAGEFLSVLGFEIQIPDDVSAAGVCAHSNEMPVLPALVASEASAKDNTGKETDSRKVQTRVILPIFFLIFLSLNIILIGFLF